MTTLTLTEVIGEPREWAPKDHPERKFLSYRVKDDKGTTYEINRKPESGPPKLGPDDFEITPGKGDFPPKLKRVQQNRSQGNAAKDAYWENKEKRDLQNDRRMGRAHAQEMAIRVFVAGLPLNQVAEEWQSTYLKEKLTPLIDWFDQDVLAVGADVGGVAPRSGEQGADGMVVDPTQKPSQPAADVSASPSDKANTSRLLNQAGVPQHTQRMLVHKIAGDPPTQKGLEIINAAVKASQWDFLFDDQGIERPPHIPDTRDLPPAA